MWHNLPNSHVLFGFDLMGLALFLRLVCSIIDVPPIPLGLVSPHSMVPCVRKSPIRAAVLLALAISIASSANGQFSAEYAAPELHVQQQTNLFAVWEGDARLEGFFIELPHGWTLGRVFALRHGYIRVPLAPRRVAGSANRYRVWASPPLRGEHELILAVKTGDLRGVMSWSLIPFSRVERKGKVRLVSHEGYRITHQVRNVEPVLSEANRVLALRADDPPWLLRRNALPTLEATTPFTVELWIRTTALDRVILSTWSGENKTPYPLELVVDDGGHLRYFRGEGKRHISMASDAPVADGRWHHTAVVHDPEASWSYLYLDGVKVDSLYSPMAEPSTPVAGLALGHRLPLSGTDVPSDGRFVGEIDELRIWPHTRSTAMIRESMHLPVQSLGNKAFALDFDEPVPAIIRRAPSMRVPSTLALHAPVRDFEGSAEAHGVVLEWEARATTTQEFVVERSTNGQDFEPLGQVAGPAGAPGGYNKEETRYSYVDNDIPGQVVFYRLLQRFSDGVERMSGTIKLGLGIEKQREVLLLDNFPNPFNPQTTITYEVRKPQHVRVSVWDLAGQMVSELVDRSHEAGDFTVQFDGSDLPSGTYFVRLEGNKNAVQTRKIILMK